MSHYGTKLKILLLNNPCTIYTFATGEEACTDCELVMEEYPHKFTSKLKGQKVIEHDRCEFEIDVEADDAEV